MEIVKHYDLIFSLGRCCHCAGLLEANNLRLFDGPWDWSGTGRKSGIYKRLEALCKGFDGWFNEKDFKEMDQKYAHHLTEGMVPYAPKTRQAINNPPKPLENPEKWYFNPKTRTYYAHDFHVNPSFKEQWPAFKKRYERRIDRAMSFIKEADSVLLVYMNHIADQRKDLPLDRIKTLQLLKRIRAKYPDKKIDLYMFNHSPNLTDGQYVREVWDVGVVNYISNHEDVFPDTDETKGHFSGIFMMPKSICRILEQINLTDKFEMI